MIEISIPGRDVLRLKHLVLDYNGTLATDGSLITGVQKSLNSLADKLAIHVITADTFEKAAESLKAVNCQLTILSNGNQQQQKADFVKKLGKQHTVAIGNGLNDALMLKEAALGLAVIQEEGAAVKTVQSADIAFNRITDALGLLLNPMRLIATLRV